MKKVVLVLVLLLAMSAAVFAETGTGVKKRRPLPYEYGRVVINNYSERAGLAPVVFDHWVHRAMFTCRVCHVDVGFSMKADQTDIKASDNMSGYYCGTCHNGTMKVPGADRTVFASCEKKASTSDVTRCERCHSLGKKVVRQYDFGTFASYLPKGRFGNGVDWEKAEEDGLIKPLNYLEGVSIKREQLKVQPDFALSPKVEGMPEIIFSHRKHTVWNGCEVCHPEIFVGVKKGTTKYTMAEIFDGKYCGVCHGKVAFPLLDCQRCHVKPV